jgi:hypothetical protein
MKLPETSQSLLPGFAETQRFNPSQRRAFGSVPGLLEGIVDIPEFHQLDALALRRVEPDTIRRGLFDVRGNLAVDGVALNPAQYKAIIRHQPSFLAAIRAGVMAASTHDNDLRYQEKQYRSALASLDSKHVRHEKVLQGLSNEADNLQKLAAWQKAPGYARTNEMDLRVQVTQAWQGSFMNILSVLRDQHRLHPEEHSAMEQALAYRLFKGSQRDRMAAWGGMLDVSQTYNNAVTVLFEQSDRQIAKTHEELSGRLADFYDANGLLPK